RIVRRILQREVLASKVGPALLGIEQHAEDLRVLLQHVLAHADAREREAKRFRLDLVPAGADRAVDATVREMVDGREGLGQEPGVPVEHAVDHAGESNSLRLDGGGRKRRDPLERIHLTALRWRFLKMIRDRKPIESHLVGKLPEPPYLIERPSNMP